MWIVPESVAASAGPAALQRAVADARAKAAEPGQDAAAAARKAEGWVEAGRREALEVRDDGAGIAPELLDKVQEPFFTTKVGGTGLGLAICRALVWQNGGCLAIDSAPGAGTRVSVELAVDRRDRRDRLDRLDRGEAA
mgnify:CR=1 FL=1